MGEKNNDLQLYSLAEAAKNLRIGRDTLKGLIAQGKIGVIKLSKRNKISHSELERFLAESSIRLKQETVLTLDETSVVNFIKKGSKKRKSCSEKFFDGLMKEKTNG